MNRLPITWPSVVPPSHKDNPNPNEPWDFKEQGRMLSAPTREKLIEKITSFRAANGYELGDVALEVDRWMAAKTGKPVQVVEAPLKEQAKTWLASTANKIAKSQIDFVTNEQAENRASICRLCPKNQEVPTGCLGCEANQDRLIAILTHGRKQFKDLRTCGHFKFDNRLAVHLQTEGLVSDPSPNPPAPCWNR